MATNATSLGLLGAKIASRDKTDSAFKFASGTTAAPTYRNLARPSPAWPCSKRNGPHGAVSLAL